LTQDNPALDALKDIVDEPISAQNSMNEVAIMSIVNGIKTCGPFFSAALTVDSLEIDKDIDEMLSSARKLISDVQSELSRRGINTSDSESAAINAFCIRVISENWEKSQEVFEEWVMPITQALIKIGISAEYRSTDFKTSSGSEITANIIASGDLFNALNKTQLIPFSEKIYLSCVKVLHKACNSAIDKLIQFHIPYEDTDQVRHHIIMQAGRIFVSVIQSEFKHFNDSKRLASISDHHEDSHFSFEEIYRKFNVSMDSFVTAIYVNSRMVS
jgi:hypothetical protein